MALSRGTGVATYGRTLTHCLHGMGHPVDVIYGMNISKRTSSALREVIFFDSLDQEHIRKRPIPLSSRWWADRRADWGGHEAVEITITGRVEGRGFAHRMPSYDRILNVPALFRAAHRYYRRTRRFMTIRVQDPPAIMHWTYPLPIRLKGARNIYTVHDLVPLRLPHTTLDDKGFHFRLIADLTARADAICTVSEASRRDILSFHPGAVAKVFNTYQSFQPSALALARPEAAIAAEISGLFGLQRDGYFLFFGSLEPKKNIGRMIEAFLATDTGRPLVLVGAMAWKSEGELRFLKRGTDSGQIVHLEYLPEPVLMGLIRGARAVLFPSLTEGFGLPVLEALSLGTPVLTSREGALPEVAGDAAVYVDAYDTASIAAGIAHLDKNDATCAALRAAGPPQAELFSIAAYEARLGQMYAQVLGGGTEP
ncbi:glycosyltransferase family 4 protein [Acidisoma cladoniae]|jgi:glycosyltransferase involved in cell wall biosynthesis|uniref:glycosyltransferase family 4 protein n=1 Tax=Acidisoma cladoniae TaxID=3040935 RepID=UPI00254FD742|nr:glycosyltransferase family 1 protein [Acidisoma sp. PAMC 29798]